MKVVIVGSGYVGLTTGCVLAYVGHEVKLLDVDARKIELLKKGESPIHERGLGELIRDSARNLTYIDGWDQFDAKVDVVIVAVGTPLKDNGDADLSYVEDVAHNIGLRITDSTDIPVIVNKSTVPIGSARRVKSILEMEMSRRGIRAEAHVASNPEFLREGNALFDTFYPDRIVIGVESKQAGDTLKELYLPILEQTFSPPPYIPRPDNLASPALVTTNMTSAELIKYAANSFLAVKISFINEFANLAEQIGANISEVATGIGLDRRIGAQYLSAGIGWGGSCFGKDTQAIVHTSQQYDCSLSLVSAAIEANIKQRTAIVKKLQKFLKVIRGRTIGILGLSFKPNTDDLRDAPSMDIIRRLLDLGAYVKVYDPVAMTNCRIQFPDLTVEYCNSAQALFEGCHAVLLVTEWEEFRHLPLSKLGSLMKERIFIDGRNVINPDVLRQAAFSYSGIGRTDRRWEAEYLSPVAQVL